MDDLNTVVRVMYGTGQPMGPALVIGASDAPQFLLQAPDGRQFWWRQDLCRGAKEGAEADYWKARAQAAEQRLEAARDAIKCWCEHCDTAANGGLRTRMSVCPDCGDKRCQRALHHGNECSKTPNDSLSSAR